VAEHFEDGPEVLFREIHRVLKPNGLFFVVVPFNNAFRQLLVNPALRALYAVWRLRGKGLGFTEFRYAKAEMDRFLVNTRFETVRVLPDAYFLPWSKGLFVDLCVAGAFFHFVRRPPYAVRAFASAGLRTIQRVALCRSCEGRSSV